MFRKLFAFVLLGITAGSAAYAQTPEPRTDRAPQAFSWTFDGGGSYLGVETSDVTKENFARLGLREVRGVAVEKVMEGSPAQAAGLQNGDVILKLNGEEISSVRKLTRLIGEIAPDHQARISVLRGGSERELTVTLGKRPTPKLEGGFFGGNIAPGQLGRIEMPRMGEIPDIPRMGEMPGFPTPPRGEAFAWGGGSARQIGVGTTPLTKQLAEHFGVESGAMINNVRENSPAAKAGLKAGDIVIEADGKPVKGDFDLIRAVGAKKEGSINLTIVRGGNRQTISVTPEEMKGGHDFFFQFPDAPDAPGAPALPGKVRMTTPGVPTTPMPLNNLLVPGRVI